MSENLNPSQNLASERLAPKAYSAFNFNAAREANLDNSTMLAAMQSRESNIDWQGLNAAISSNIPKDLSDESSKKAWVEQETINAIMQASEAGKVYFTNIPKKRHETPTKPADVKDVNYSIFHPINSVSKFLTEKGIFNTQEELEKKLDSGEIGQLGRSFRELGDAFFVYDNTDYDAAMENNIKKYRAEGRSWNDLNLNTKIWIRNKKGDSWWNDKDLLDSALTKPYKSLSKEEKEAYLRDKDWGDKLWDKINIAVFDSQNETTRFNNWRSAKVAKELAPKTRRAVEMLDSFHAAQDLKSLYNRVVNGEINKEEMEDYLNNVKTIAEANGFTGIAYDSNYNVYVGRDDWNLEQYIELNDTLLNNMKSAIFDNKFSIVGSIVAGTKGFTKGGSPFVRVGRSIGYAAGAAGLGAAVDNIIADNILDRDSKWEDILRHSANEAGASAVGDVAVLGLGKTLKTAGRIALKTAKTAKAGELTRFSGKLGELVKEYAPIISFTNRALDGNAKAADKLLAQTMSPEQQTALKEFGESFGGGMQFSAESKSVLGAKIKEKFGEESAASQAFEKLTYAMSLPTMRERQAAYIQAIRADETGNLIGFLTETLAQSPKASANFRQVLNATTREIEKNLEHLNLNKADIKGVFDDLEQATKQSYDEAMNKVLGKIYDDSYKVVISRKGQKPKIAGRYDDDLNAFIAEVEGRTPEIIEQGTKGYDDFRLELEKSGVSPQDSHAFLNFVEKTIYNQNGVTFSQLLNAQKVLNSFYKETKDPNLKSHIKNAIEGFLRDDIKKGIDDIFKQNPTAYKDAVTLYETALTDYANMSRIKKMVDKKKIRNAETTQEAAVEALIKLAQGQGDKISNFEAITRALTPQNRKVLEMNILESMFQRSLYDKNSLRVLDSGEFFKNLQSLPKDMFQSQEAKDFIALASGFDKLYKNDVLIARAMKPATTARVGSSIATSIEGAAKFQIVRMAFDQIIRLMPHIPYATGFNQKVSGAALRYQLKTALERSSSVSEFKQKLKGIVARTPHNNQTKEIIQKITQAVDTAQDTIIQGAETINAQAAQAIKEAEAEAASAVNPHAAQNIPTNPAAQGADIATNPAQTPKTTNLDNTAPSDNATRNASADDLTSPAQNMQNSAAARDSIPTQSADNPPPSAKFSENEPSFKQKAEEFFQRATKDGGFYSENIEDFSDFKVFATPILKDLNSTFSDKEMSYLHKYTKERLKNRFNLANPKERTISAVDKYLDSAEASTLTGEQINAITALKDITPEAMPENIDVSKGFDDLLKHFKGKADKKQREVYLKLFDITRERPNITLQVHKDGETRNEYIKAFQHKQTKDLYYIAIFGEGENARVTGIPTTDIKYIINEISKGEVKNVFK